MTSDAAYENWWPRISPDRTKVLFYSKPAWSLDGQTIYFHRMVPPDYRFKVFRIGNDGRGLTDLTAGAPGVNEHPSH